MKKKLTAKEQRRRDLQRQANNTDTRPTDPNHLKFKHDSVKYPNVGTSGHIDYNRAQFTDDGFKR